MQDYKWLRDFVREALKVRINDVTVESAAVGAREGICNRQIEKAQGWLNDPMRDLVVTRLGRWVIRVSDSTVEADEEGADMLAALTAARGVVEAAPMLLGALEAKEKALRELRADHTRLSVRLSVESTSALVRRVATAEDALYGARVALDRLVASQEDREAFLAGWQYRSDHGACPPLAPECWHVDGKSPRARVLGLYLNRDAHRVSWEIGWETRHHYGDVPKAQCNGRHDAGGAV